MTGRVNEIDVHCATGPLCLLTELLCHRQPNGCELCLPGVGFQHHAASFPSCGVFDRLRTFVRTGVRPLDSDFDSCLLWDSVTCSLTFGDCFWLVPCPLQLEAPRPCEQVQQWLPPQVWQRQWLRLSPWACCHPTQLKWAGKRLPQQPVAVERGPAPRHQALLRPPYAPAQPAAQGEAQMAPCWTAAPVRLRRPGAVAVAAAVEESWAQHQARVRVHFHLAHKASLGGTTYSTGSQTACPQRAWFLFEEKRQADPSRCL